MLIDSPDKQDQKPDDKKDEQFDEEMMYGDDEPRMAGG